MSSPEFAALSIDAMHASIGQYEIVEGVDLRVAPGETVALLGRNGAGKSTTLRSVMGLTSITAGSITVGGHDIRGRTSFDIARLGVGYVPEQRGIFSALSVRENLRLAERAPGQLDARRDAIYELFPDLERLGSLAGNELSGGQQQMLAIARVLVPDNRLLLIDEPSEGLAPVIVEELIEAIRTFSNDLAIVLVEQNIAIAAELADTFVIIEEGRSVANGTMTDFVDDADMMLRYLSVT